MSPRRRTGVKGIPTADAATLLAGLRTFFVRDDAYGLALPGAPTARTEMGRVTAILLEAHLQGRLRIGAHSTDSHYRARWVVIDLDSTSVAVVLDLTSTAARHGVPLALEASKTPGHFHVWAFFAELVPAWKARALGRGLLQTAGWGHGNIEVFPKQDSVVTTERRMGNFVWLPWHGADLPHGRTVFLDLKREQWPPYEDQAGYLMGVRRIAV